ncbi:MAG: CarD family transcriptional regulator [Clostridiaceae bacterium]|nr:CarD family transcriptional regulator [Clostridiaceae bacterium]
MYKIGDLVVYGNNGVCKIIDIVMMKAVKKDVKQPFYVLALLHQKCTIFAPVNSTKVFMRPIISKTEAERLIDLIPTLRVEAYHNRALHELSEHYKASLSTHDCADLIELTLSIYAKKQSAELQKRKIGVVDEKFMKKAEDLLFSELSAALGISKDKVQEYIAERVNDKLED